MTQGTGMKAQSDNTQDSSELPGLLPSSSKKPGTDFESTLNRMKTACRVSSDKMLADALDVKHSTITTSRRRGAVPASWLLTISDKTGVSVDWLRTGEGEMARGGTQFASVKQTRELMEGRAPETRRTQWSDAAPTEPAKPQASIYNDTSQQSGIADLVAKTIEVLQSNTVFETALKSNIEAFHRAIVLEKQIDQVEDRIMAKIGGRLDALESSNQQLQTENAQLRHDLEESRAASAIRDTG